MREHPFWGQDYDSSPTQNPKGYKLGADWLVMKPASLVWSKYKPGREALHMVVHVHKNVQGTMHSSYWPVQRLTEPLLGQIPAILFINELKYF